MARRASLDVSAQDRSPAVADRVGGFVGGKGQSVGLEEGVEPGSEDLLESSSQVHTLCKTFGRRFISHPIAKNLEKFCRGGRERLESGASLRPSGPGRGASQGARSSAARASLLSGSAPLRLLGEPCGELFFPASPKGEVRRRGKEAVGQGRAVDERTGI